MSTSSLNEPEDHPFKTAVIFGASGTIGKALCNELILKGCKTLYRIARHSETLPLVHTMSHSSVSSDTSSLKVIDLDFDLMNEQSILKVIKQFQENIDLVVIATGWLHDLNPNSDKTFQPQKDEELSLSPEKTFKSITPEHLTKSWQINFLGPSLILKNLLAHLKHRQHKTVIGVLSARVGSISDNKMGGWYSYRCSKAALNMMIKNLSLELHRLRSKSLVVALQPGTTDSNLSKPFQKFIKPEQLQSPEFTASHLLNVLKKLNTSQSGELMDFAGQILSP